MTYVLRAGDRIYLRTLQHDMIESADSVADATKLTLEQAMEMAKVCGRYWSIEVYEGNH